MNLTQQGLALIRRFEGFRACAYRDAAGIWTIGFGHTSAAGAPHVRPGMKISRKEGLQILARDVASFALGVERLLDVELSDSQFSALVSFAYNVGLGNFRKSSVLGAVNARDFAAVPRRLSLWVKCRGCVLPGLVNRRAAEAAMFLSEVQPRANQPMRPAREPIEPLLGKPMRKSSTGIAAMLSGAAGLASSFSASLGELTHVASTPVFPILAGLIILAAVFWIIRERHLKALEDGVMIGLFKIFGPLLGKIAAGPVLQIIDKLVPDADLRTRLKAEIRNGLARRDIALTAARRAAVLTELRSDSWMTRSWRPALMFLLMIFLLFFGLLLPLMELCLGQPLPVEPHLDRLPEPLWNLLALGVGGYVGGRTVEKIATQWAKRMEQGRPQGTLAKRRPIRRR